MNRTITKSIWGVLSRLRCICVCKRIGRVLSHETKKTSGFKFRLLVCLARGILAGAQVTSDHHQIYWRKQGLCIGHNVVTLWCSALHGIERAQPTVLGVVLPLVSIAVEKLVTLECLGPKNWPKSVVLIDIDRHHHRSHHHLPTGLGECPLQINWERHRKNQISLAGRFSAFNHNRCKSYGTELQTSI